MSNQTQDAQAENGAEDQRTMDETPQSADTESTGPEHEDGQEGLSETEAATLPDLSLEEALEKLADAEEAAARAKDDLLRLQAEMQNLRRRTQQDVEKAHKYGQEKFSSELLAVMDNLERALESAKDHEDEVVKAIYEGVDLTLKSFSDCFTRFEIKAIDPLGEPFDPLLHQAISMQENPDVEPNSVVAVVQKGYTLHGRVIRPAMVLVSKGASPEIDEQA